MRGREAPISFRSGDEVLVGRLCLPPDTAATNARPPAVILVHGLGSGAATMRGAARELAQRGVAALTFDQRGHGRSTGVYAGDSSADIAAAAAFLTENGLVDASRIAVMGHSSGAREAILACVAEPRIAVLVCTSTPGDSAGDLDASADAFYRRVRRDSVRRPDDRVTVYPRDGALPWLDGRLLRFTSRAWSYLRGYRLRILWPDTLERWARVRPSAAILDLPPRPTLFVHCAGDRTVPPVASEILFQKATGPKELMIIPGGWHGAPLTRRSVRAQWMTWLAKALAGLEVDRGVRV